MAKARFQVRVWTADNSRYRVLPARYVSTNPPAKWRLLPDGGYGDATLVLNGALADPALSGVMNGVRIEFYGINPDSPVPVRLYRGYVRDAVEAEAPRGRSKSTTRQQVILTLYGIYERASKQIVRQRYAFAEGVDLAVAWSRIANKWVKPKVPGLIVYSETTGQEAEAIDGWRKTAGELLSDILRLAGGGLASGCDVDPLDNVSDRFFLRPFGSASAPSHVWPIPTPVQSYWQVLEVKRDTDQRNIANVVDVRGGVPRFPNIYNRGGGFEYPVFGTGETGNMLVDGGFEAHDPAHVLTGGASFKSTGLTEGPTDGGTYMVELDSLGEQWAQTQNPPTLGVVDGNQITAQVRMRLGAGPDTGMKATLRLHFLDSGGSTISSVVRPPIEPVSATWETYSVTGIAPAGATGVRAEVQCTTDIGGTASLMLDNVSVYDSTGIIAEGMTIDNNGHAIEAINWAYEDDSHQGAYCFYLKVNIVGGPTQPYVVIYRPNTNGSPAGGNQSLRFSAWFKNAPGSSSVPDIRLTAQAKLGATPLDNYFQAFPSASCADWTRYSLEFQLPGEADTVGVNILVESDGEFLMDSISLRDQASDPDEYIESVYEQVFRAEDIAPPGPVQDSNADYGDVPTIEDLDSITTGDDGERFALAVVNTRATEVERPVLQIVGRAMELWPGQYVRLVGSRGIVILPEPKPIMEVEGEWNGALYLLCYISEPRPGEVRTTRLIAREAARRATSSTSSLGGSSSTGSGSTGGGGGESGGAALGALYVNTADSTAIANTAAETNFDRTYSVAPAIWSTGTVLRVTAMGKISADAVAPTLQLRLKAGGLTLFDLLARAIAAAASGTQWRLTVLLVCRSTGVSGTIAATLAEAWVDALPVGAAQNVATVDTTAAQTLQVSAQWSAADPDNTTTLETLLVERLN